MLWIAEWFQEQHCGGQPGSWRGGSERVGGPVPPDECGAGEAPEGHHRPEETAAQEGGESEI